MEAYADGRNTFKSFWRKMRGERDEINGMKSIARTSEESAQLRMQLAFSRIFN
jgi:hypothetical protein